MQPGVRAEEMAALSCFEQRQNQEAAHRRARAQTPFLVPMGMDEYAGIGKNSGWFMEDGRRTRRI